MPSQIRKKMKKELKDTFPRPNLSAKSDSIKPEQLLSRIPAKNRKTDKSLLDSFEKNISIKKKKRLSPHSRRSTPGEVVGRGSAPHHVHQENEHWMHSTERKIANQNKIIGRKLAKKRGR